jgi:cytochrome P450
MIGLILDPPADPYAAVTHPDPYPYYAALVAERPLHRDERLGAWVAASAAAVEAVLASPALRVRPPGQRVPADLAGSAAAEVFGNLVRMNDGPVHAQMRAAVTGALDGLELAAVARRAEIRSTRLLERLRAQDPADLTRFAFDLPVLTIAAVLGLPEDDTLPWQVQRYVLAASGLADAVELAAGKAAARALLALAGEALDSQLSSQAETLLTRLARQAKRAGCGLRPQILANAVGLLSQTYEATAALIGATLVALARHPEAMAQVRARPERIAAAVAETIRWDPSTQVMRRFAAEDVEIAGASMRAGDAVLALPGAANRDPAANPDPHRFDIDRLGARSYGVGAGVHACPAHRLAPVIAAAGIRQLLAAGLDPSPLPAQRRFRRSPFRITEFA